ncbi:hypothetical protein L6R29_18615, partial [Myxococcota bacterium]|nr:hypothetical protein [Myxococcota bacterium]
ITRCFVGAGPRACPISVASVTSSSPSFLNEPVLRARKLKKLSDTYLSERAKAVQVELSAHVPNPVFVPFQAREQLV